MKNYTQSKKNGINTAAIDNQLHQHLAERAKLQQRQDDLWNAVHRGYDRTTEMKKVDEKIGKNTYAIDQLIGQLVRARCRSGRAYSMAVDHLKQEIARNQRIIASWYGKIRDVQSGRSHWISPSGEISYDCTFAFRYVERKKQKTANTQRLLSQLIG
jgi:hypothetical protein